jgi:hypothetical protein
VVAGFDVNELFSEKPVSGKDSNPFFEREPVQTSSIEQINRINVEEARIQALPKQEMKEEIAYSELFGRKIEPEDAIDTKNTPFDFLEGGIKKSSRSSRPSAKELDSFEEAETLPLQQKPLPTIRVSSASGDEVQRDENEYFSEDEALSKNEDEYDKVFEDEEQFVDNSFLSKLSDLKDDVLSENRNSVGFGIFYTSRVGSAGIDALDTFILPSVDAHYYGGLSHHLYGHMNFINMSNGQITGDALQRYGDMKSGGNVEAVSSLSEVMVGYEYKMGDSFLTAEVGMIPQPAVVPEAPLTWNLKYSTKKGKASFDLAYVNKSVKDSMLSRVGDTYNWYDFNGVDDTTTKDINESIRSGTGVRGAVTKEGVEIGAKYSVNNQVFAGNINYYYSIAGYNVLTNEEMALTLLYLKLLDIGDFNSFMIGPIFLYDNYTYNSGYFTMGVDGIGNGGYFSPKNFMLLGLYFDMAKKENANFFWKVKGNLGLINFSNGKDIFDNTTEETEITGFGYEIKGFGGYKVDESIEMLGAIGYQSSGTFSSLFFGLTAIYYFGENKKSEIGDLLYSNTIGEMAK